MNPTVGDIKGNLQLCRDRLAESGDSAEIVIFPECVLVGYPAMDLLYQRRFVADAEAALAQLASEVTSQHVIIGSIRQEQGGLYNTAALLHEGGIVGYRDKVLLPTYDVFDEARYFQPGQSVEKLVIDLADHGSLAIGIHTCEDLWDDDYPTKVCDILGKQGIDLFINVSASPYRQGNGKDRAALLKKKVQAWRKPFLYCNLVGAQDELIFDGRSMIIDRDGTVVAIGASFKETIIHCQFDTVSGSVTHLSGGIQGTVEIEKSDPQQFHDAILLGIKDYFNKTNHREAVIGISGGVDSALVAALAVKTLGNENVIGVSMPGTYSSDHSMSDAQQLAQNLNIRYETLPIEDSVTSLTGTLMPFFDGTSSGIAEENLQARIRGVLLMAIANKRGALVLTTGNKTEIALGYATLYGDMAGALAPIGDLSKTQVYALCRYINETADRTVIPENILTKAPSAELRPDQVDPFDYEAISPLVDDLIVTHGDIDGTLSRGYAPDDVEAMAKLIARAEYKRRQAAPVLRVTAKAFGVGRRYPIVNKAING